MASDSAARLRKRQRAWASGVGLAVDRYGYLPDVEANLFQPLVGPARSAFEKGKGSELRDQDDRPAKMRALHSSSALAVNFFDYWDGKDASPLSEALALEERIEEIEFESPFPTKLGTIPPHLDVTLQLASGVKIAIESKFSEWMREKSSRAPFGDKYFQPKKTRWSDQLLPKSQSLVSEIRDGTEYFKYLDAPQLLKHSLGLATQLHRRFALHYYYFDWPGEESKEHTDEIERFTSRVDPELGFVALSYQTLFARLCSRCSDADQEYVGYMDERYFAG